MKISRIAAGAATALALLAASIPTTASASPAQDDGAPVAPSQAPQPQAQATQRQDNLPGPFTEKQQQLRLKAQEKVRRGHAKPNAKGVVKVDSKNFVETSTPRSDKIFTILSEFGGTGPKHNQIPKPDRAKDNSTLWTEDFSPAYYGNLFNGPSNSMKDYYEKQSNGVYSVTNQVENWVTVPGSAATYGANAVEQKGGAWNFVKDTGNSWYDAQLKAGKTPAQIDAYLSQFDVWDRYDYDHDGNFNEPDGYIDHFQAVHAGEGEEAGASEDAIWSHRWYAFGGQAGTSGPAQNKAGGTQIGGSKYWIGDYTTEPENGGLGVFAHEYGHDLGLPDYYDTTNKAENGTGFWTIMSAGSWLGRDEVVGTGDTPGGFGPNEKLFLGWLRGSNVPLGQTQTETLNPSQFHRAGQDQAVRVDLPDKVERIQFPAPVQGRKSWWSGEADNLNGSLTAQVPAPKGRHASPVITVSAQAAWDIEQDYDFLYPEYSTDGGKTWALAVNTATGKAEPLTGSSQGAWNRLGYTYDSQGRPSQFRLRYQTDGATTGHGAWVDSLSITGRGVSVKTGAEGRKPSKGFTADPNWTQNPGYTDKRSERFYLIENRQFQGYDAVLKTGPYNYGERQTRPKWVQHFPYTPGMLVWLVDGGFKDNNTSQHPGGGQALPVDARVAPIIAPNGMMPLGGRRQSYDATFGLGTWPRLCLPTQTETGTVTPCAPEAKQSPTFDDSDPNAYYDQRLPYHSVQVAGHGVRATVTGQGPDGSLTVSIANPAGR
ncbi:immune inhibitor A domain-containing protein [Arthrobacter sp. UM1]|uniref:immune inhibitor A domain-containing protein n=1 Tax=Arthrobacter sp. UM1 TaxID=2766776 RepID=UPI001CF639EF|nr:immune inhibitor A domain-containing protein [Arthrobacter sp. UM1]MCB4209130.1 immune inhibitor A [Arthrobacter sp. UM1]